MIGKALGIAVKAHDGQYDLGGNPYINHPLYLSTKFIGEDLTIVALLHDVVEDSDTTLDDLRSAGFEKEIIFAIDCISKREGEMYSDYIKRVKCSEMATAVKIQDLIHNSDLSRIEKVQTREYILKKMNEKYIPALIELYD